MVLQSDPVGHETRCDKIYITITIIIKKSIALKKVNCHYDAEKKTNSSLSISHELFEKIITKENLFS